MSKQIIRNATIVNEQESFVGSVLIENDIIITVHKGNEWVDAGQDCLEIDATGLLLLPGVIDDQVHFREPGLTHKGDIYSESKAAVAGGITSFFEMPNTKPQATTIELLEGKFEIASSSSFANYSFLMGVTNDNIDELKKINPRNVAGVKMFMGSSTGNMLVDNKQTLNRVFEEIPSLIVTHCEDESTIKANISHYKSLLGEDLPVKYHPLIRNDEACYKSSAYAVELATKYNSRLHVFHLSSAKEMSLFRSDIPLKEKRITAEVCVHHLWFNDSDYEKYGNRIKWNPSIKSENDRLALIEAVKSGKIDVIATDHAPHLWSEKQGNCFQAASGGPLVQHSLVAILQMVKNGVFNIEQVVDKMCHAPAQLFKIDKRGYIRQGYFADLVLVDPDRPWIVIQDNILYKCGWSPFENIQFSSSVISTWVNGVRVYHNGSFDEVSKGKRLVFEV
jgi:dihydroorotase